jgi:predicted ATPase
MRLYLKNIGMLKEADVKLDGLTVIAGENDTGKSTVGKVLMALIKSDLIALKKHKERFLHNRKYGFNVMINLLFEGFLKRVGSSESEIILEFEKEKCLKVFYNLDFKEYFFDEKSIMDKYKRPFKDITYIQTPLIWDLENFFSAISQFKEQVVQEEQNRELMAFDFKYPYILWDLYGKFVKSRIQKSNIDLASKISKIINGDFERFGGNFVFKRDEISYPLIQVAHGIKSFGILQVLIRNGHLNRFNFLVIDEPEVHLHPKWQIEYAKLIVELVKRGVKVLITSHSPFFIEAIESLYKKTDFYLARDGVVRECETGEIYDVLAQSIDILEQMEIENLKW